MATTGLLPPKLIERGVILIAMNIPKAIEILTGPTEKPICFHATDQHDALKLGIEALKAVNAMRHYPFPDEILKLPGETQD